MNPLTRRLLAAGLCAALLVGTPTPASALRVGQETTGLEELKTALPAPAAGLEEPREAGLTAAAAVWQAAEPPLITAQGTRALFKVLRRAMAQRKDGVSEDVAVRRRHLLEAFSDLMGGLAESKDSLSVRLEPDGREDPVYQVEFSRDGVTSRAQIVGRTEKAPLLTIEFDGLGFVRLGNDPRGSPEPHLDIADPKHERDPWFHRQSLAGAWPDRAAMGRFVGAVTARYLQPLVPSGRTNWRTSAGLEEEWWLEGLWQAAEVWQARGWLVDDDARAALLNRFQNAPARARQAPPRDQRLFRQECLRVFSACMGQLARPKQFPALHVHTNPRGNGDRSADVELSVGDTQYLVHLYGDVGSSPLLTATITNLDTRRVLGTVRLGMDRYQKPKFRHLDIADSAGDRHPWLHRWSLGRVWRTPSQMRQFVQGVFDTLAAAGLEEPPMTAAEAVEKCEEAFGQAPLLRHGILPTTGPGRALVMAPESDPSPVVLGLMGWQVTVVHPASDRTAGTLQALEEMGFMTEVTRRRGAVTREYTPTAPFRRYRELGALPHYILVSEFFEVSRWWPTPPGEKDAASSLIGELARTIAPGGTIVISGRDLAASLGSPDGAALLRKQLDRFAAYQVTDLTTLASAGILPLALWRFEIAPLQEQLRALVDRVGRWTGRNLVVVHPDVIQQYPGLGVLAELLSDLVFVDRGEATVEALRGRAGASVDYYGDRVRADALGRFTGLTVNHQSLWETRFLVVVQRILSNLSGTSEAAVGRAVQIEPIAAWLEQAA
ncbi:MAG: hypothetical protein A3C53_07100 [Omnitrophica WOR_2 bacterium RIFCSPHIGHO2_02_FULL_68_15]|nr:MAG: hypothetical protein A3C53_07100 [Omnitrophica WOR_2 bacterium RIFCSPHIGHO2_02_FULL_68_15]